MRIWDIDVSLLCRNHLLGEHRELHCIWSIITQNKKGYSNHPEVMRWKNNLGGLLKRHKSQIEEMKKRGYKHNSILDGNVIEGDYYLITPINEQIKLLKSKGCNCKI
jgi:hypothetical protein